MHIIIIIIVYREPIYMFTWYYELKCIFLNRNMKIDYARFTTWAKSRTRVVICICYYYLFFSLPLCRCPHISLPHVVCLYTQIYIIYKQEICVQQCTQLPISGHIIYTAKTNILTSKKYRTTTAAADRIRVIYIITGM